MTWKHGASGYSNYDCRCAECKAGWAAERQRYRQQRKARRNERIVSGRFVSMTENMPKSPGQPPGPEGPEG